MILINITTSTSTTINKNNNNNTNQIITPTQEWLNNKSNVYIPTKGCKTCRIIK